MSGYECPKCHRTFTGLSTFDRHQDVNYSRPHADMVRCLSPSLLGMRQDRFGRWGSDAQNTRFPSSQSISKPLAGTGAGERA